MYFQLAFITEGGIGYLAVFNHALDLQDFHHHISNWSLSSDLILGVFSQLQSWRQENDLLFLFDIAVSTVEWPVVALNLQMIRFMALVVGHFPVALSDGDRWDFVLCSTASWIQTVNESIGDVTSDDDKGKNLPVLALASAAFELLRAITICMQSVVPAQARVFPLNLGAEWSDLFCPSCYGLLVPMFVTIADKFSTDFNISPEVEFK